jgi:hypothetical protein
MGLKKIYAVFEGSKILKMSEDKQECINYRNSFPEEERKGMVIAEKIIAGEKEYQQSHWIWLK